MDNGSFGVAMGIVAVIMLFALLISLIFVVITVIAEWKLFEKAGEPGWSAIIPFYNTLQMSKIATGNSQIGIVIIISSVVYSFFSGITNVINALAEYGENPLSFLALLAIPISLIGVVVSLITAVAGGYLHYTFAKSYGQSTAMCVLAIFFFPIIMLILAFDKNTHYVGPKNHIKWFE